MTETIHEMRERHKKEIQDLQDNCTHEEWTPWSKWWWAIAHEANTLRRWCKRCSKLMDEKPMTVVNEL